MNLRGKLLHVCPKWAPTIRTFLVNCCHRGLHGLLCTVCLCESILRIKKRKEKSDKLGVEANTRLHQSDELATKENILREFHSHVECLFFFLFKILFFSFFFLKNHFLR